MDIQAKILLTYLWTTLCQINLSYSKYALVYYTK